MTVHDGDDDDDDDETRQFCSLVTQQRGLWYFASFFSPAFLLCLCALLLLQLPSFVICVHTLVHHSPAGDPLLGRTFARVKGE